MKKTLFAAALVAATLSTPAWAQAANDDEPIGPPPPPPPPQVNTVPEPESFALAAMALGVAMGLRARRSSLRTRKDEPRRDGE